MLKINNLTLARDDRVLLRNISLNVGAGEVVALMGRSGSGKTSLLRMLMKLDACLHAEGTFETSPHPFLLPQHPGRSLNPVRTIGSQLKELGAFDRGQIEAALASVDLPHITNHYPHMLSGGMCQRVLLAMTLLRPPSLLLADEPTTAIDTDRIAQIFELLLKNIHNGSSALIVTHDAALAQKYASRIYHLSDQTLHAGILPQRRPHRTLQKTSAAEPILIAKNVHCSFGKKEVLHDISLSLSPGSSILLNWPSGTGKTTLLRILANLQPYSGSVTWRGKELRSLTKTEAKAFRKNVQILFQDPKSALHPTWTIHRILEEPLLLQKQPLEITQALESVQLHPSILTHRIHEVSGGEAQRILLARSLLLKPEILLCDEPTASLDADLKEEWFALLNTLQEERSMAVVLVTHERVEQ